MTILFKWGRVEFVGLAPLGCDRSIVHQTFSINDHRRHRLRLRFERVDPRWRLCRSGQRCLLREGHAWV